MTLNWESLTKNLFIFNFNIMGVNEKSGFFRGEGATHTKRRWRVWQLADLRGGEGVCQKRGCVFYPILQDRVHAVTLPI